MKDLNFEYLQRLVRTGAGIRIRQRLQPAGGPGDKVFPPTYARENGLKYAVETRRVDGRDVPCVLLDSVASQANRMEEALLEAWRDRALDFPVIGVDFTGDTGLDDLGQVTTLQAPHRIADAILRDAVGPDGKLLFRDLPEGKAFTDASPRNATAVYLLCPTALLFGVWDSTGPKGGLGAKFQRAMTSEIVAIGAKEGVKVASRIDPLGIQANVPIFHSKDNEDEWTIEPSEAKVNGGKPVPFVRGKGEGKGKPSSINHSNIAPSIDEFAGGVTFDYALQTTVLSMPALRRLRFATALDGTPLAERANLERAAQVALAALSVAAIVHLREHGYDLRSRCVLLPDGHAPLEALHADGTVEDMAVDTAKADALVREAAAAVAALGLAWQREPLKLKPAPKLVALIRKSRSEAAAGGGEG